MEREIGLAKTAGMSLIELLITIAILGIALGTGVPALSSMVQDNRLVAVYNQVSSLTAFARSEASKRNVNNITLCKADIRSKTCSDATGGFKLMVFIDDNGNGKIDLPKDALLKEISIDNSKIKLNFVNFSTDKINFLAAGMPEKTGKLMICDDRGTPHIKGMLMNISGQLIKASAADTSCT